MPDGAAETCLETPPAKEDARGRCRDRTLKSRRTNEKDGSDFLKRSTDSIFILLHFSRKHTSPLLRAHGLPVRTCPVAQVAVVVEEGRGE